MSRQASLRHGDELGFTLVELLAVIAILGVISFTLTEAFVVGLKTTDANATDLSRSVAVQAAQSYFTDDVQSAKEVSRVDPPPTTCATAAGVFLHLSWKDQGRARDVSYAVEDAITGQAQLVRWSCTDGGSVDRKMLGLFTFEPPLPQLAQCDGAACPDAPGRPLTVTLRIPTDRPQEATGTSTTSVPPLRPSVDLTVRRRTT